MAVNQIVKEKQSTHFMIILSNLEEVNLTSSEEVSLFMKTKMTAVKAAMRKV